MQMASGRKGMASTVRHDVTKIPIAHARTRFAGVIQMRTEDSGMSFGLPLCMHSMGADIKKKMCRQMPSVINICRQLVNSPKFTNDL